MTEIKLWNAIPGPHTGDLPRFTYYEPSGSVRDAAVVIFPGGGYTGLAEHEGRGYAEFLAAAGFHAFVCEYRVKMSDSALYPWPLLDARRAVRLVRTRAAEFGIDPRKIAVMGSSAGGHLAGMLANFRDPIDGERTDEADGADFMPDATVLCYTPTDEPLGEPIRACYELVSGDNEWKDPAVFTPTKLVDGKTPPAFIWHTSDDGLVSVEYAYRYAAALRRNGVPHEVHVFPHGSHGLGLAGGNPSVGQWGPLLLRWFAEELGW